MNPYLVARQISFHRHDEPVFEPVDFSLSAGTMTLLTGSNGSGKTTLMRVVAGILRATEGSLIGSHDMAFIGHRPAVKDDLDCVENLEFAERFYPTTPTRPALSPISALAKVGLSEQLRQQAGQLSAGQRRRLALARLLVAPADIWLLDEPYTSLDVDGCQWVDTLLDEHLRQGGTALVSTHARKPSIEAPVEQLHIIRAKPNP